MSLEGGAQTNFTTAGSSAGKGLVTLGLFPTERAMTLAEQSSQSLCACSTVSLASRASSLELRLLPCRMGR